MLVVNSDPGCAIVRHSLNRGSWTAQQARLLQPLLEALPHYSFHTSEAGGAQRNQGVFTGLRAPCNAIARTVHAGDNGNDRLAQPGGARSLANLFEQFRSDD